MLGSAAGSEPADFYRFHGRDVLTTDNRVGDYVERGRGALYWSENERRGPSPLELVRKAVHGYSSLFGSASVKLGKLNRRSIAARGESRPFGHFGDRHDGSPVLHLAGMAMGTTRDDGSQQSMWVSAADLPRGGGHPFYERLNRILEAAGFDAFVEGLCARFYAAKTGRPGLAPGRYFRLLLIGYFEGLDSERAIAWRAADSLGLRTFLRLALPASPPDHSTISRTRRLFSVEAHQAVFGWVLERLAESGLVSGKTLGIDATTAGGECGDAEHRASGHGRGLHGVPDPSWRRHRASRPRRRRTWRGSTRNGRRRRTRTGRTRTTRTRRSRR